MKINTISEKIGFMGKETKEKKTMITISEAYSIWNLLDKKYSALITTKILIDQIKDTELKKIVLDGLEILENHKKELEKLTKEFSITMPERPAEDSNTSINYETITDKFIYRLIIESISTSMFQELSAYQKSNSSMIRDVFMKHLLKEIELYDGFYEYGKMKAYLQDAPAYRL